MLEMFFSPLETNKARLIYYSDSPEAFRINYSWWCFLCAQVSLGN